MTPTILPTRALLATVGLGMLGCIPDLGGFGDGEISCTDGICPDGYRCNQATSLCVESGVSDLEAPQLVGMTTVTPSTLGASASATVVFQVSEPLLVNPEVTLDNDGDVRDLGFVDATDEPEPIYTYTYVAAGDESQVASRLAVVLVDVAGNTTRAPLNASVTFDFQVPLIEAGSERLTLIPGPQNPLPSVTQATVGTTLEISFATNEPIPAGSPPVVHSAMDEILFSPTSASATAFTYSHVFAGELADGVHDITVDLVDNAGNTSQTTLTFAGGPLSVDSTPPLTPDVTTAGAIVYDRVPWGDVSVGYQAYFGVRGAPASVEANAWVLVLSGPQLGVDAEVGRALAGPSGNFGDVAGAAGAFSILDIDLPRVFVTVVDAAGNASDASAVAPGIQASKVRDITWTASMVGKIPGDPFSNPHRFEERAVFTAWLAQPSAFELGAGDGLAAEDSLSVRTEGAASWRHIADITVPPGAADPVAYDPISGALIGSSWTTTSRLDGSWVVAPTGDPAVPPLRPTLTYDGNRGGLLSFGGLSSGTTPTNEMWLWNGRSWREICASSPCSDDRPAAREDHAAAWDEARRRVVVFGGSAGSDETWEWDGQTWAERCTISPCADSKPTGRSRHAMAYDRLRGETLLFGGDAGSAETWAWDGDAWQHRCTAAPCNTSVPLSRYGHAMTYDAARDVVVMFGGCPAANPMSCAGAYADVWTWDGGDWSDVTPAPAPEDPSANSGPVLSFDGSRDRVVLTGQGGGFVGRNYEWDGASWHRIFSIIGLNRSLEFVYSASAVDVSQRVVFDGGEFASGTPEISYHGFWNGWGWEKLAMNPSVPGARTQHAMAYLPADQELVIFGGAGAGCLTGCAETWAGPLGDMRLTCEETDVDVMIPECAVPPRNLHAMATAPAGTGVVLFGGRQEGSTSGLGDTWLYDSGAWTQQCSGVPCTAEPTARLGHGMTYVPGVDAVWLFGGFSTTNFQAKAREAYNDVWEWKNGDWTELSADGTGPVWQRARHGQTWDPRREKLLVAGGDAFGSILDSAVWEFDGAGWYQTRTADPEDDGNPPARFGHVMEYDPPSGRVLYTGGHTGVGAAIDTWVYRSGADQAPGHVFEMSFAAAGAPTDAVLEDVEMTWYSGAVGYPNDTPTFGVDLRMWDGVRWVTLTSHAASSTTPELISWSLLQDPTWSLVPVNVRRRLLFGPQQALVIAATPTAPNGTRAAAGAAVYGAIETDFVSATVSYRLP